MVLAPSAMSSTSQKECVKRAVNCGRIQSCSKGTERPKGFFFLFFFGMSRIHSRPEWLPLH